MHNCERGMNKFGKVFDLDSVNMGIVLWLGGNLVKGRVD